MTTFRSVAILALAAAVALAACGKGDDSPPPPPPKKEGRAETQAIRNTDAVGYGGKQIANKIDDALNKSDQNRKQVEQQSTEEPADPPQQ